MNNITRLLLITLTVFAAGGIAYAFNLSIEYYDDIESTGWSVEAKRNPYLAAQLFMRESGLSTPEADSLLKLDSLDDVSTLFITDPNQVVSPRQLDRLMDWLERGGVVIVAAGSVSDADDLLLSKFGVRVEWARDHDNDNEADDESSDDREHSLSESLREYNRQIDEGMTPEEIGELNSLQNKPALTVISFEDDTAELEVAFNQYRVLDHPYLDGEEFDDAIPRPFSWSMSEHGVHMMQFEHGNGLLTIISDPTIWQSYRINQHDHAYLLWMLTDDQGDFAILYPADRDSLWALAGRYAGEMLIALALLTCCWLWHIGQRFGPAIYCETGVRRALGEHFVATAGYLWHTRSTRELLSPLRDVITRRANVALPGYTNGTHEEQIRLIAARCQVSERDVSNALTKQRFSEADFIHAVKLLQHIERHL